MNGRFYIGQAKNLKGRRSEHLRSLERSSHHSIYLQRHYTKYGREDLQFAVLEICSLENLTEREQFYLDTYKPSLNMCFVANSMRGLKHSDEFRRQVGDRFRGDNNSMKRPEIAAKISQALKGRSASEETKLKLSKAKIRHGWHSKHYPAKAKTGVKRTISYSRCEWCGMKFSMSSQQKQRKYCSDYCARKAKEKKLGEDRICLWCGNIFKARPRSDQKYCSYSCDKQMRIWRNSVTLICKCCGKRVWVRKNDIKKGKKYCSLECSKKDLVQQRIEHNKSDYMKRLNSKRMKGKNNPNYGDVINNAVV